MPLVDDTCTCTDCTRTEPVKLFKPLSRDELYEKMVTEAAPGAVVVLPHSVDPTDAASLYTMHRTDPASPVTNPKEGAGSQKPPTWSVMPRWVNLLVGRVMQIGAAKYDAFNYREAPITASTYEDAMERHAQLWFDGEDSDPETGVSHLASIMASCALLLDSQAGGMLVDNRQKTGKVRKALDELEALRKSMPLPPKNPNAPSLHRDNRPH